MSFRILSLLLIGILITACADNRVRKQPPVPSSPDELITGCYYIVDDSTAVKRSLVRDNSEETYYINPKPIMTVGDFKRIRIVETDFGHSLNIQLDEKGSKAFAAATKRYTGKPLAFIIYGELVMAPVVQGEITGGSLEIAGDFSEAELKELLRRIDYEMYEP